MRYLHYSIVSAALVKEIRKRYYDPVWADTSMYSIMSEASIFDKHRDTIPPRAWVGARAAFARMLAKANIRARHRAGPFRRLGRVYRWWLAKLLGRYDVLTNIVGERNLVSIRWLRWLGFAFSAPLPLGNAA